MPAVHDDGGAPRPKWLTETDTSGKNDLFSTLSGGTGVRVEPDALKDFSGQTGAQAQAFQTAFTNGVSSLLAESSKIGASTSEASTFTARHGETVQQLQAFTRDAGIGLTALGQGAQTIAVNYIDSDTTQAATMADVDSAFRPREGSEESLRHLMTAQPDAEVTAEDEEVAAGIRRALPEPNDTTPDQAGPDAAVDPRSADQTIRLGNSGDTYVVGADDDIETRDPNQVLRQDGDRVARSGDHYDPTEG